MPFQLVHRISMCWISKINGLLSKYARLKEVNRIVAPDDSFITSIWRMKTIVSWSSWLRIGRTYDLGEKNSTSLLLLRL